MSQDQVADFFYHVLDVEGFKLLWLLGSQSGRKQSFWFEDSAELAAATAKAAQSEYHVYFGVGSRKSDLGPFERGGSDDYLSYRCLWLDLDVMGPNHKSDRLPPSIEAARELLTRLPLKPTYVVNSGGGLQAYWCLAEPATAAEMEDFLPTWAVTWKAFAEERGWHVDNVFDLGRVMRVPGSINRKNDAPVQILECSAGGFNLSDFEPFLAERVEAPPASPRDPGAGERPGDAYNRGWVSDPIAHGRQYLEQYGFVALRPKHNGELPYSRPGKGDQGSSATIYPDGHVTVYSSDPSLPTTMADKVGKPLDPFGVYAMFAHDGDWEAATRALREAGYGDPLPPDPGAQLMADILATAKKPDPLQLLEGSDNAEVIAQADPEASTWTVHNLFDLADAEEEAPPSVGIRSDLVHLLYPGKVHTVFGEPGGMKSWFAQCIACQVVEGGGNVLFADFENSKKSIYDRFSKYLGISGDELRHIEVTTPDTTFGPNERKAFEALAADRAYELIVVDGTTDAMVTFGLNPNESVDAARFDKLFLKVLAATGAAVLYVDHVTKDKESRGSWGFGSQHKKSAIDGASFGVEMVSSFGKGMRGRANILIHKDKNGDLLQHALDGVHSVFCELDMDSHPVTNLIVWAVNAPSVQNNPNFRPSGMMERISKYVTVNPGLSKDVIITGTGLREAKKDWVGLAFEKLQAEGYLANDLGEPRDRRWRSLKPFSEIQDHLDTYGTPAPDPKVEAAMDRLRARMNRDALPDEPDAVPAVEVVSGVAVEDLL